MGKIGSTQDAFSISSVNELAWLTVSNGHTVGPCDPSKTQGDDSGLHDDSGFLILVTMKIIMMMMIMMFMMIIIDDYYHCHHHYQSHYQIIMMMVALGMMMH